MPWALKSSFVGLCDVVIACGFVGIIECRRGYSLSVILLLPYGWWSFARQPRSVANFQYILPRLTGDCSLSTGNLDRFELSWPVLGSEDSDGCFLFIVTGSYGEGDYDVLPVLDSRRARISSNPVFNESQDPLAIRVLRNCSFSPPGVRHSSLIDFRASGACPRVSEASAW